MEKKLGSSSSEREHKTPSVSFAAFVKQFYISQGWSNQNAAMLTGAWRENSCLSYQATINNWQRYCDQFKINPVKPSFDNIVSFHLHNVFVLGASYIRFKGNKAALSFMTGTLFEVQQYNTMMNLVSRTIFNKVPPLPKKPRANWDVNKVLNYIDALPDNEQLMLNLLTMKLATLLMLSTLRRQREKTLKTMSLQQVG